jgi:hypothetical protein
MSAEVTVYEPRDYVYTMAQDGSVRQYQVLPNGELERRD